MNEISIKSSSRNTPEVKISKSYLDFLHARIIHDGTSNKNVSGKVI